MEHSINDIVSINFRIINILSSFIHTKDIEIPFAGDDIVITESERDIHDSSVKKYSASAELADQVRSVFEQYDITGWPGKPSALPKVIDEDRGGTINLLFIRFSDDCEELVTFRETPDETSREAGMTLRRLILDSLKEENLLSAETVYPKLSECKKIHEEHGPICRIESHYFSTGMMAFSNLTIDVTIEAAGPGIIKVTRREQRGNEPEQIKSAETDSDIMDRLQAISDEENLPVWTYVAIDPEKFCRNDGMMDYFPPSCDITIYYDDTLVTGISKVRCSIGDAVCRLGGREVYGRISDLIAEATEKAGLIQESAPPKMAMPMEMATATAWGPFGGMNLAAMAAQQKATVAGFVLQTPTQGNADAATATGSSWTCTCGSVNTTRFCPNCGGARI
ncbi:MAG: hypothetical protein K5871_10580 [Lachnospiraceae bacterium]|nr:hypothetical protein [Lachnospiraceae bacterium]